MNRLSTIVVAWAGIGICVADAAPLPRYEPPGTPPGTQDFDLRGTVWSGKTYEKDDMTLTFKADGTLSWSYNNNTFTTGTWKLESPGHVWWEMNQKYCEFRGVVTLEAIQGDSWNVVGLRWKTNLNRVYGK